MTPRRADMLEAVKSVTHHLDHMDREPTTFEAGVLETVLRQLRRDRLPSQKQHAILCQMIERYLGDPVLLKNLMAVAPE